MTGAAHHGPFGPMMFSWSMPVSEEFGARPVRAFLPGPGVQVDETVWPAAWEDLSLVIAWRQFMRDPRSYFRHLSEES
jgi:hypothetical protein